MDVNKIRGLMAEKGENQGDLAKVLNLSRNAVQLKLSNKVDFKAKELKVLCEHYNVDPNYFFAKEFGKIANQ